MPRKMHRAAIIKQVEWLVNAATPAEERAMMKALDEFLYALTAEEVRKALPPRVAREPIEGVETGNPDVHTAN